MKFVQLLSIIKNGEKLRSISGHDIIKSDETDMDHRCGLLAYGF
jgi:hypothetical protein